VKQIAEGWVTLSIDKGQGQGKAAAAMKLGGEFESVETYFTLRESIYRLSLNVVVIDTFGGGVSSSPCHADAIHRFIQPFRPTNSSNNRPRAQLCGCVGVCVCLSTRLPSPQSSRMGSLALHSNQSMSE
jgi:hypothetical protein